MTSLPRIFSRLYEGGLCVISIREGGVYIGIGVRGFHW